MTIKNTLLSLFVVFGFLYPNIAQAQGSVVIQEVDVEGFGRNQAEAIYDGLSTAVMMVNGVDVATISRSTMVNILLDGPEGASEANLQAFQRDIFTLSSGVVQEFKILRSVRRRDGSHEVKLKASIAKYENAVEASRTRLAILPLRIGGDVSDPKLAKKFEYNFRQALVNYLVQTRKFAVLDRDFVAEQMSELGIVADREVPKAEIAKLGNRLSTDFLVVGSIDDILISSEKRTMKQSGNSYYYSTRKADVSYRVLEAATGQLELAKSIREVRSFRGRSVDRIKWATEVSRKVGLRILLQFSPIYVEAVRSDVLYLGIGGDAFEVGQHFNLIKYGPEIIDSHTGESLGREEIEVGIIEIVDTRQTYSRARLVEGDLDLSSDFSKMEFTVQPVKRVSKSGSKPKDLGARDRSGEEAIDEFDKKNQDDW